MTINGNSDVSHISLLLLFFELQPMYTPVCQPTIPGNKNSFNLPFAVKTLRYYWRITRGQPRATHHSLQLLGQILLLDNYSKSGNPGVEWIFYANLHLHDDITP